MIGLMVAERMPLAEVWNAIGTRLLAQGVPGITSVPAESSYEVCVAGAVWRIGATYGELWRHQQMLAAAINIQEIRVLLKLYIVSWSTLSDLLAILVNEILMLGYTGKDISLSAILRNRRVRAIGISDVINKHRAAVQHELYSRLRNEAVHRGTLDVPELDALDAEWLSNRIRHMFAAMLGEYQTIDLSADNLAYEEWCSRVRRFAKNRALAVADHLRATQILLDDVGAVLIENLMTPRG